MDMCWPYHKPGFFPPNRSSFFVTFLLLAGIVGLEIQHESSLALVDAKAAAADSLAEPYAFVSELTRMCILLLSAIKFGGDECLQWQAQMASNATLASVAKYVRMTAGSFPHSH